MNGNLTPEREEELIRQYHATMDHVWGPGWQKEVTEPPKQSRFAMWIHAYFPDFEAFSWRDYAAIPYYMLRYALAWVKWRPLIAIRYRRFKKQGFGWAGLMAVSWGRREDPTPVMCSRCLWAGQRRNVYHGYHGEDSEAVDECPKCGAEL